MQNDILALDIPNKARALKMGKNIAVNMLDEDILFGENGFAYEWEDVRGELYFMLDYGWDLPYITNEEENMQRFGDHVLNEERFPSFTGTPAQRLKKLQDKFKEIGWKGLMLWVASQPAGFKYDEPYSPKVLEFFKERILWAKEAGIEYWKLDLGKFMHDTQFRNDLNRLASEIYPELIIEQTICPSALNGDIFKDGRFLDDWRKDLYVETFRECKIFRSGDVSVELSVPTTFDRIGYMLKNATGNVNCECDPYIAAGAGYTTSILRSATDTSLKGKCLDETRACIRWHSIAPPFQEKKAYVSDEVLLSQYTFGETWVPRAANKTVTQGAFKVFSRDTRLPDVEGEAYVCASQNGKMPYSVAVLNAPGKENSPVTVTCYPEESTDRMGVFGRTCTLRVRLRKPEAIEALDLISLKKYKVGFTYDEGFVVLDELKSETRDNSLSAVMLYFR